MVDIIFSAQFEKAIKRRKSASLRNSIEKHIRKIIENPDIGKPLRYSLRGERTVRVRPFRIIYSYDEDTIIFHVFEHRDDAYD